MQREIRLRTPDATGREPADCPQRFENGASDLLALLGYGEDSKLLIVHADDLGMAHSINHATFNAFERGAITSASVMVPCPWFAEVCSYASKHPNIDIGLHVTLTSEWQFYRWGPCTPKAYVSSLCDSDGCFWRDSDTVARTAKSAEVELEISHQLARVIQSHIRLTHIDSHMLSVFKTPSLFASLVRVARKHQLPFLVAHNMKLGASMLEVLQSGDAVLDAVFQAPSLQALPVHEPKQWMRGYAELLRSLQPGISQLIVHLGFDDSELRAITSSQYAYGSAWRQRDYEFVMSQYFRELLNENKIHLVSWGDIQKRLAQRQVENLSHCDTPLTGLLGNNIRQT